MQYPTDLLLDNKVSIDELQSDIFDLISFPATSALNLPRHDREPTNNMDNIVL